MYSAILSTLLFFPFPMAAIVPWIYNPKVSHPAFPAAVGKHEAAAVLAPHHRHGVNGGSLFNA